MSETKEQVKHTETPWNIFRNEDGIDHIGTGTRKVVAFPWNKFENDDEVNVEDEANAEFIVRAVNCHEELLASLKAVTHLLQIAADEIGDDYPGYGGKTVRENLHDAKAIITKAEEK